MGRVSRRDWWVGIALEIGAILLHALVPRYEVISIGRCVAQHDRWTGRLLATNYRGRLSPVYLERESPVPPAE